MKPPVRLLSSNYVPIFAAREVKVPKTTRPAIAAWPVVGISVKQSRVFKVLTKTRAYEGFLFALSFRMLS